MAMTREERQLFATLEAEFRRSESGSILRRQRWRLRNRGGKRQAIGWLAIFGGALLMLATLSMSTSLSFLGFLMAFAGAWLVDIETWPGRLAQRIGTSMRQTADV